VERSFPEGTVLVEQSDTPKAMYALKQGLVGMSRLDESGVEVGCTTRGPGAILGLDALVGVHVGYRVWALTEIVVCEAPFSRLNAWVGSLETPLGALLRLAIEEGNARAAERLEVGGSAVARIARLLLQRCAEHENERLALSQRLLARVLSMTPETVSRALAKLHAVGAVVSTRPIAVGDVEVLRRFACECAHCERASTS
jgi:CRP-like cAMP-binding protein